MAAVPHFDMKPGERLKALREVPVNARNLLGNGKAGGQPGRRADVLLEVRNLHKSFTTRKSGWFGKGTAVGVRAVDDVSFDIRRGECLGLVGESGCGKTTVSKILMRAITPDGGSVTFNGGQRADRRAGRRGRRAARRCAPRSRWCSRIRCRRCRRA